MESESDQLKMSHIQAYKDIFLSTTCLLRVKKLRFTYYSRNTNCMERILQSKIKIPFDSHMRQ